MPTVCSIRDNIAQRPDGMCAAAISFKRLRTGVFRGPYRVARSQAIADRYQLMEARESGKRAFQQCYKSIYRNATPEAPLTIEACRPIHGVWVVIATTRLLAVADTIDFLRFQGFPKGSIILFAKNQGDVDKLHKYSSKVGAIVLGRPGLLPQRAFIEKYVHDELHVGKGTPAMLSIDDDIDSIFRRASRNNSTLVPIAKGELKEWMLTALEDMKKHGAHLAGLNVSTDWRNMKMPGSKPITSCGLVNGGVFLLKVRLLRCPANVMKKIKGVGDDAIRTLLNFRKDRVVLRY